MPRPLKTLVVALLTLALAAGCEAQVRARKRPLRHRQALQYPSVPALPVASPPAPLTQERAPAAPRVTYSNGLLEIQAENSTLVDVLKGIGSQLGLRVETPASAYQERVFFQMGPAPARDVVAALLQGGHYDYFIIGSATDPNRVKKILLTQRTQEAAAATVPPADVNTSLQTNHPTSAPTRLQESDDEEGPDAAPLPQETAPPPPQPQPSIMPAMPNEQNTPRTPDEMLQDLRRMNQQQQQQQQRPQQQPPFPQRYPQLYQR